MLPTESREFLCKLRQLACIHARWLTADAIAQDGRLSLQRLQHFERKRKAGTPPEPYASMMEAERVIAAMRLGDLTGASAPEADERKAPSSSDKPKRKAGAAKKQQGKKKRKTARGDGEGAEDADESGPERLVDDDDDEEDDDDDEEEEEEE